MFLENKKQTSFLQSNIFVWLIAFFAFVFWHFDLGFCYIFLMLVLSAFVMIKSSDLTALIPVFILMFFALSSSHISQSDIVLASVGAVLFVVGVVVHIIKFRKRFEIKNIKRFSFALLLILPSVALGGVGRTGRYPLIELAVFGGFLFLSLMYLFLFVSVDGKALLDKVVLTMSVMGVLICVMFIKIALECINAHGIMHTIKHRMFSLGWEHANNVAILLASSIVCTISFAMKMKKMPALAVLGAAAQAVALLLTGSRGVIVLVGVALPLIAVYSFCKSKNRLQVGMSYLAVLALGTGAAVLLREQLSDIFFRFVDAGFSDNGRFSLFSNAFELFLRYPMFGVGFDYRFGRWGTYQIYWFHSTPFQILASLGLLGVLSFGYFIYARYYVFFKKFSANKLPLLASLLLFDLYGLIDVVFFHSYTYLLALIFCLVAEKMLPKDVGYAFKRDKKEKSKLKTENKEIENSQQGLENK